MTSRLATSSFALPSTSIFWLASKYIVPSGPVDVRGWLERSPRVESGIDSGAAGCHQVWSRTQLSLSQYISALAHPYALRRLKLRVKVGHDTRAKLSTLSHSGLGVKPRWQVTAWSRSDSESSESQFTFV